MKPTPTMFDRLRARPLASAFKVETEMPAELEGMEEPPHLRHRHELVDALSRAQNDGERRPILDELEKMDAQSPPRRRRERAQHDEIRRALEGAPPMPPAPAAAGHIAVRLMGVEEGKERIPLGGLRVRARAGESSVEGVTDAMGQVLLRLDVEGSVEVEALAPEGEVVLERATGRIVLGQSLPVEIGVKKSAEIEDSFARGQAWNDEVKRRAERIEAERTPEAANLDKRLAALEAAVAQITQMMMALTKDGTKGVDNE